jgi:hypothetical protein
VYWKKGAKTSDKIALSLIKMLREGPDVSFNGSPTVSPITAERWAVVPLATTSPFSLFNLPLSIYFLALSQAPPVLEAEIAIWTPETKAPGNKPATALGPNKKPTIMGVRIT